MTNESNQTLFKKKKLKKAIILIKMKHHCGELDLSWFYSLPTGSQAVNRKIRIQEEALNHIYNIIPIKFYNLEFTSFLTGSSFSDKISSMWHGDDI